MISSKEIFSLDEEKRVEALLSYGDVNCFPVHELDEITKSASIIFNTPISTIGLMDHTTLTLKSKLGITLDTYDKDLTFCKYTIQQGDIFIVEDCLLDERFKHNPMVQGYPFLRFYAGVPLQTPSGYKIGALCVADHKPNTLNEDQKFVLKALANQVISYYEKKKQNQELKETLEKIKILTISKDDFSNKMSEELKTPLNIISGFTEILSEAKLDSRQKELFKIIKSSIEIMSSLVNDILDYSKIESGSLIIEKHPFNIRKFLKRMLKFPKIKAKEKYITTDFYIDKNIPSYVNGDKIRLHQILTNIIGNAIKFTDKGNIKLNVDLVNQSKEEAEIKFTIKDNGTGMSQHKIDLIFERYKQEDNPRLFGGSGLGLCIANKLVELQKGKLNVVSQLGKGSEFIFSLKYQISNEQEIADILTAETKEKSFMMQNLQGKRILFAAENAINANLIKKVFEGTGAQIDVSENGKSCIEKLKQNSYDIILMDLFIPEMDGFETTKFIRKTLKLQIPILGFSANASELDKEKCLKEGMNDYITKPFKTKDLFKKIFKLLPLTKFELPAEFFAEISKKLPIENVEGLPSEETIEYKPETSPIIAMPSMSFHDFLDHEIFKEYTKNDKVFEESLIQMFLKEIPEYFNELEMEIKRRNFLEIKKKVYKLKSPLAIFGYKKIVQKLINIEKLCDLGEIEILRDAVESKHYLDSILKEMKMLYDSYAGS